MPLLLKVDNSELLMPFTDSISVNGTTSPDEYVMPEPTHAVTATKKIKCQSLKLNNYMNL